MPRFLMYFYARESEKERIVQLISLWNEQARSKPKAEKQNELIGGQLYFSTFVSVDDTTGDTSTTDCWVLSSCSSDRSYSPKHRQWIGTQEAFLHFCEQNIACKLGCDGGDGSKAQGKTIGL